MTSTLEVYNNTSFAGNFFDPQSTAQDDIVAMAFDNLSGHIFALSYPGIVSVISDSTNEVIDTFFPTSLGTATGIAFDYKDNEIFILYTNSGATSYVDVVSPTSTSVLATVDVGEGSSGIVYDSGLGEVFVSNAGSESVSVISTASNLVVATIDVADWVPEQMVYDSGQNEVFVIDDAYDVSHGNITVISDATNTPVATILVPYGAISLGYDRAAGEVFVGSDIYGLGGTCNITAIDDSTNAIVATIDVGIDPTGIADVPSLGELYVTNAGSNNVSVIATSTNTVSTTVTLVSNPNVPLYTGPTHPLYDAGEAEVWFWGGYPGFVNSISTSSHTVTSSVWLTFASRYFAYDSARQEEFLADPTSGYVVVVSDVTDHDVSEIPVAEGSYQLAYDSGRGEVWVVDNTGLGNISVINDTTNTVVDTFHIPGVGPTGIAYDPAQGEMFVGNEYCPPCSNVTVINDTTYHVVGVVDVGFVPFCLAYDAGKGEIFAANEGGNVTVINAVTDQVVASIGTGVYGGWGMAYDSAKGEMFLANLNSDNVTVLSDATNTVVANIPTGYPSWGIAYDPAAGEVMVGAEAGGTISAISDTTNTVAQYITPDGEAPSSVAYDATTGDLCTADQDLGTLETLTPTGGTGPAHYSVTFIEKGLPTGTDWGVTFNATPGSSMTNSIGYSVLDGSYTFSVGTVAGYVANITGGPVTVAGAPVSVDIGFTPTGVPTYAVMFDETGLPSATSWTVTLNGGPLSSPTPTIQFTEADGMFSFTVGTVADYTSSPSSGTVDVSGAPVTKDIVFSSTPTYPVEFTETGLPTGSSWSVTLSGTLLPSSTVTIETSDGNGSYPYTVSPVTGYTAAPSSGTVQVAGGGQTVAITFTAASPTTAPPSSPSGFLGLGASDGYILVGLIIAVIAVLLLFLLLARRPTYPIVFTESGLPPGTRWSVRLKKDAEFSDTETIRFTRPSGTYEYEVEPSAGHSPVPATGYVVVEREQRVVPIRFGGP